jgi:SulP family sulfate permease
MRRPAPDAPGSGRRGRGLVERLGLPSRRDLPHDLLAGVTVGAAQVGNSMAYTMLAGIPPVHGLYAVMSGSPSGALTSSSERMSIVPTAVLSLAAGGVLATLPPQQRVAGMFMLAFLTGAVMLVAGLLRAGGLVRFISDAVMVGFMAGISVTILLGQLAALTGFSSAYDNRVEKAADMLVHLGNVDLATTTIGLATVVLVLALRRTRLRLFAMAIALVVLSVAVAVLHPPSVAVVGDIAPIPRSLPVPRLPDLALIPTLLLPAVSLTIIGLVQGAGISRTVPNSDGVYGDASRDFIGQGVANVVSGCFTGGVVGGSVQATALDVGAGARTRWSSVFAGLFVVLVVLVAAPLVQQVPLAVTAGILIVAASSALRPRAARDIWRADRMSAAVMVVTFVLVLVVPLQYAVLAGAAITVLKYIYLSSTDVRVTQVVSSDGGRLKEIAAPRELSSGVVTVLDIYGSLFFAAGPKVREALPAVGDARCPVVVLRVRGRGTLHSATIALLREYAAECAANGGRLYLAGVGQEMEDQLRRTRVLEMLGSDAVVPATDELYGSCALAQQRGRMWLEAHSDAPANDPGDT